MRFALDALGRKRVDCITTQDMASVLFTITESGVKPTTQHKYMRQMFSVLIWAKKRGVLASLPDFPELPQAKYEHFIPPTPDECAAIMQHAPRHVQRVIVLGSKLGMRVGPCEMFRMRWEDVDFERSVVRVHAAEKNKNEPWREVPIKSSLLPLLRSWHAEDMRNGVEWVISYMGKPVKRINTTWNNAVKRAGISRTIRPYDLRHAFATDAIAAGADVGTVAKLMGHANVNMVLTHYQHVLTQQKKAAVEALPDVPMYDQGAYVQKESVVMQ
jgi:integrase